VYMTLYSVCKICLITLFSKYDFATPLNLLQMCVIIHLR